MSHVPGPFSTWLSANLHLLTLWVGAICTLGLYSVLYKENKIYRLFEHIFLGLATGFMIANIWNTTLYPKWWQPMWEKGQWWLVFALVAGLSYYFIYSRRNSWIARLTIGFFLGVSAGQTFQAFANDTWPQIPASFRPIIPHGKIAAVAQHGADPGHPVIKALTYTDALNNLIFMVILVCVLSYFFFSFEQRNPVIKGSAMLGRWMMMFAFGAIFGLTMMARLALLIDRMYFLMFEFGGALGSPPGRPSPIVFGLLLALIALVLYLVSRRRENDGVEAGSADPQ